MEEGNLAVLLAEDEEQGVQELNQLGEVVQPDARSKLHAENYVLQNAQKNSHICQNVKVNILCMCRTSDPI